MSRKHSWHSRVQSRIPAAPAPLWSRARLPKLGQVGESNLRYQGFLYSAAPKAPMAEMRNVDGERERLFSGWFFRNLWLRRTLSNYYSKPQWRPQYSSLSKESMAWTLASARVCKGFPRSVPIWCITHLKVSPVFHTALTGKIGFKKKRYWEFANVISRRRIMTTAELRKNNTRSLETDVCNSELWKEEKKFQNVHPWTCCQYQARIYNCQSRKLFISGWLGKRNHDHLAQVC